MTQMSASEWARERLANSERIANMKDGADRDSWLEDVAYWQLIVTQLTVASDVLTALKALMADIDSGLLVRDITCDGDPGWSMHMLAFVQRLQSAQAAIAKAEAQ